MKKRGSILKLLFIINNKILLKEIFELFYEQTLVNKTINQKVPVVSLRIIKNMLIEYFNTIKKKLEEGEEIRRYIIHPIFIFDFLVRMELLKFTENEKEQIYETIEKLLKGKLGDSTLSITDYRLYNNPRTFVEDEDSDIVDFYNKQKSKERNRCYSY